MSCHAGMLALISAKSGTIPAPSAPPSPKVLLLVAAKLGPSRTRGTPDTEEDCTTGTWNDIYPHAYDPLTKYSDDLHDPHTVSLLVSCGPCSRLYLKHLGVLFSTRLRSDLTMAEIHNGRCHPEKAPMDPPPLIQNGKVSLQCTFPFTFRPRQS